MTKYTELIGYFLSLDKCAQHRCCHGLYPWSGCVSFCGGGRKGPCSCPPLWTGAVLYMWKPQAGLWRPNTRHNSVPAPVFSAEVFYIKIKQDKACFPSCVRASGLESSSPMPSSLYFSSSSSSRLGVHLLFPLPCCYDGPALPSWPNVYLSIQTGK